MSDLVTQRLVEHLSRTKFEALQEEAITRAQLAILDIIAVALAGSTSPIVKKARAVIRASGGRPDSRVLVFGERLPAHNAAFVNAVMSRALDFDDTYELAPNGAHASAYIIPVAMALADRDSSITGKEFLSAIVLATDLYCRLTRSIRANAVHTGRDNGSSVFGTYACAACLLRLDETKMLNGFGIAYAQCAGEFQMYEEETETIALQQGMRARAGIDSADLAASGLIGPHETFFGRYGFFRAFEPLHDVDLIMNGLGRDFISRQMSYKPFPCCKMIHSAISATLTLRGREKIEPADIRSIRIGTNRLTEDFLALPKDLKWNPQTLVAAKFSLPYGVAVAAAKGDVRIVDFDFENLDDSEVRRLLAATTVEVDPDIDRTHGEMQNAPAMVYITLADGREVSQRVDRPVGHPLNLPDFPDVETKLQKCVEYSRLSFDEAQLAAICSGVRDLPRLQSASQLLDLVTCIRSSTIGNVTLA